MRTGANESYSILNEYDLTLVRKEFERMKNFAATARNPFEIDSVKAMIENTYYSMLNGGCIDE